MALDMFAIMLKGMGIDPTVLLGQAMQLGAAFEKIAATQADILERLNILQAGQDAIAASMGLYVTPPSGSIAQLIADESRRHVDSYGGDARQSDLLDVT